MARIENEKVYRGADLDRIFFTPMLNGETAEQLGIRVLYNAPTPTTLHHWSRNGSQVLQQYTTSGWNGSQPSSKIQKTIDLARVKAEIGYSADDYFSLVFNQLGKNATKNFDDLSGTALEEAETAMFKDAIAEGIRATMWYGKTTRANGCLNSFNGIIPQLYAESAAISTNIKYDSYSYDDIVSANDLLEMTWVQATITLQSAKPLGQLAFFVTPDIYRAYEDYLMSCSGEALAAIKQDGFNKLSYRGIPLVMVCINEHEKSYNTKLADTPKSFILLTDRLCALAKQPADNPPESASEQDPILTAYLTDYIHPALAALIRLALLPSLAAQAGTAGIVQYGGIGVHASPDKTLARLMKSAETDARTLLRRAIRRADELKIES